MQINKKNKTITASAWELHMVANYLEHCVTDKKEWTVKIKNNVNYERHLRSGK